MIVCKFGGTSVGDAEAIARTATIIGARRERRPIVVVSALAGATNALLAIAEQAARGQLIGALAAIEALRERHLEQSQLLLAADQAVADDICAELSAMFDELAMLADALNTRRKSVNGAKILIAGVAYKRDTNDVRESPALLILEALREKGAAISFSDPYVPSVVLNGQTLNSLSLTAELMQSMDCVAILTDHSVFDYGLIANFSSLVFDTRNAMKNFSEANVVRL